MVYGAIRRRRDERGEMICTELHTAHCTLAFRAAGGVGHERGDKTKSGARKRLTIDKMEDFQQSGGKTFSLWRGGCLWVFDHLANLLTTTNLVLGCKFVDFKSVP